MHPNNFTLYQLVKYHIELTEAMEYTLITYKSNEGELNERLAFLKEDYNKGFYHQITSKLFYKPKKLTKDIKHFIKRYNTKKVLALYQTHDLHPRIEYNNNLYLACETSNNIIKAFLNEEKIKKEIETSLLKLIETTNNHFILFALFNSLNLYVSSKVILLQGDELYTLLPESKSKIIQLINSIKDRTPSSLAEDSLKLINEEKAFDEEDAYELLNKVSIECMKAEQDLYTDFESFTSTLEKEIEKGHK